MLGLFNKTEIRVRIAPSPTGPFHIGTAKTALFNYLFAKQNKGVFVLRIEDTDLERSDSKWEKDILEGLRWLGIEWDEGPYKQSEKLPSYAKYLEKLFSDGNAYYCFCTEKELETKRQEQISGGGAPKYSGKCRQFSREQTAEKLGKGENAIIRFKAPVKIVKFKDLIRGEIEFDTDLIGDFSIAKDLASPLYNFAVVVDDFEMKISHVIRGEDHISNTPKQILLQEALGFPSPEYAHLPLILGSDRSKLSKRHGAVAVAEYREQGYLPEALINFMAFLGWNPGTEKEIYNIESLVKEFSLDKVQKSGAIFNIQRLDYLNGYYIRQKSAQELAQLCQPYLPKADLKYIKNIVALYRERLKKLSEITELADYFFKDVLQYDKDLLNWKGMGDTEVKESLDKLHNLLSAVEEKDWEKDNLEKVLMPEAKILKNRGVLLWPFRVAITGKKASAGPFEAAEVLGKEKTIIRIKEAIEKVS